MDASQSNILTIDRALEHLLAGRLDEGLAHFEEDARWGVADSLPERGLHQGRAAMKKMLSAQRERFPGGFVLRRLSVWSTSDHVFAECTRAAPSSDGPGEHILILFALVLGKIRDVREFAYSVR